MRGSGCVLRRGEQNARTWIARQRLLLVLTARSTHAPSAADGGCVINESMLTGESVPVAKTPLPSTGSEAREPFTPNTHKAHALFCGTHVTQVRTCT